MLVLNNLKNIKYLQAKEAALIAAKKTATQAEQREIDLEMEIILKAKKALLEKQRTSKAVYNYENGKRFLTISRSLEP